MRETHITIPELALVAATRGALGAGIGLLLADRLTPEERRAIGWTLFAVGAPDHDSAGVRDPGPHPQLNPVAAAGAYGVRASAAHE